MPAQQNPFRAQMRTFTKQGIESDPPRDSDKQPPVKVKSQALLAWEAAAGTPAKSHSKVKDKGHKASSASPVKNSDVTRKDRETDRSKVKELGALFGGVKQKGSKNDESFTSVSSITEPLIAPAPAKRTFTTKRNSKKNSRDFNELEQKAKEQMEEEFDTRKKIACGTVIPELYADKKQQKEEKKALKKIKSDSKQEKKALKKENIEKKKKKDRERSDSKDEPTEVPLGLDAILESSDESSESIPMCGLEEEPEDEASESSASSKGGQSPSLIDEEEPPEVEEAPAPRGVSFAGERPLPVSLADQPVPAHILALRKATMMRRQKTMASEVVFGGQSTKTDDR